LKSTKSFINTLEERTTSSIQSLKQKIDLKQPGFFPVDREKSNWPGDVKDADDLWERRLRLDIFSELLGDERTANNNRNEPKQKPSHETKAPEVTPEKFRKLWLDLKNVMKKLRSI
jgi:hypothetical protein